MPLTSAEKMRALRGRRREAGLCVDCGSNPRPARPGHVTCGVCSGTATARKQESRKKSKPDA